MCTAPATSNNDLPSFASEFRLTLNSKCGCSCACFISNFILFSTSFWHFTWCGTILFKTCTYSHIIMQYQSWLGGYLFKDDCTFIWAFFDPLPGAFRLHIMAPLLETFFTPLFSSLRSYLNYAPWLEPNTLLLKEAIEKAKKDARMLKTSFLPPFRKGHAVEAIASFQLSWIWLKSLLCKHALDMKFLGVTFF